MKDFKLKPKRWKIGRIITNKPVDPFNRMWRKMPDDVKQVWMDDMSSNITGFSTIEKNKRRDAAVLKYPHWFKWETKYNKIPLYVHDAFRHEVNGAELKIWLDFEDHKLEDGTFASAGMIEQIEKGGTVNYYDHLK